ncbi:hypothetical protein [Paenibacillus pinihumi]|uniref:hypothetical protein n=1 Tax=Paenibacillus pinihumi TaxID=669462 RepID=UPI000419EEA6|nr:hypothetical protein [Paenibacillus pinihumi]
MKKLIVGAFALFIIVSVVTVPKKADFTDWLKNEVKREADNAIVSWGINLLGGLGDQVIQNMTVCDNYVVAVRCTAKLTEKDKITAIGMFNRFFSSDFK